MLLKRGTGNGERGTEVWERVVSGNLHKNPIWPMIGEREPSVVETNLNNVAILLELIMLMRCLKEYGGNDIFHLFALRFTKQLSLGNKICSKSS